MLLFSDPEFGSDLLLVSYVGVFQDVVITFDQHVARGSHGIDYPTAMGSKLFPP
jgi:hypothetical protein